MPARAAVKRVDEETAVACIERHQPYTLKDPKVHSLWLLHHLDVWDKHRVLQVGYLETAHVTEVEVIDYQESPMKDGATLYHVVYRYPSDMDVKSPPAAFIAFAQPGPAAGYAVLGLLGSIYTEVDSIKAELVPLFPRFP